MHAHIHILEQLKGKSVNLDETLVDKGRTCKTAHRIKPQTLKLQGSNPSHCSSMPLQSCLRNEFHFPFFTYNPSLSMADEITLSDACLILYKKVMSNLHLILDY